MAPGISSLHRLLTHACPGSSNPYDFQGCWSFNTWIKNVSGVYKPWFNSDQTLPRDDKYLLPDKFPVTCHTHTSRRISLIFYISWHPPPIFHHHHWWTAEQTNKTTGWPGISDLRGLASHYVLGHWFTTHLNVRVNWEFLKKHYKCPRIFPEDKHLNIPMWDDLCFLIPSLLQVILITASIENWEQKTIESIQVTV